MRPRRGWARLVLPIIAASLILCGRGMLAQPAPQTEKPEAAASKGQGNWPRKIQLGEGTLSLDAPQAQSLEGTRLKAQGSATLDRGNGSEPAYGTVWYEADVDVQRDKRIVSLVSVTVPRVQIAGVAPAKAQQIGSRLEQAATRQQWKLPLDDVLASVQAAGLRSETPPKLNMQPPRILFESQPAILVVFDGEPRFRAVEGSRLERAQNTPFLVLHDARANAYYLNGGTMWFHAPDPKGPWVRENSVPPEAAQIAAKDLKEGGVAEGEVKQASQTADKRVPTILVATEPTELIVSEGAPQWSPAVPGELDALSNSESDVFRTPSDQQYWIVLSGRWYRSAALSGPWTYVQADTLPPSFHKIPGNSTKARRPGLRARHQRGARRRCRRVDAAHGRDQTQRGSPERDLRRRAEVRVRARHARRVRAQHAGLRAPDPRPLLRLR